MPGLRGEKWLVDHVVTNYLTFASSFLVTLMCSDYGQFATKSDSCFVAG